MHVKSFALAVCALSMTFSLSYADNIVETASKSGKFKTLVAAVKAAGLAKTLSGHQRFTVFAPTDEAFAKLPKGTVESLLKPENKSKLANILTFHVVPGRVLAKDAFKLDFAPTVSGQRIEIERRKGKLAINGAGLLITDIKCDNGVIHVIDTVMLPESKTIPEVAASAKSFKTLLTAVKAAGLESTLSGDGPFTVFAPTDEAFSKLPEGTLASLLKPENKNQLINILKYHVIAGRVFSDQAIELEKAKTLLGKEVGISVSASGAQINDSKLVLTDVEASNGVIHVIDSVLLPPSLTASEARQLFEESVSRGAKLYNQGKNSDCAKLYAEAMTKVINNAGADIPSATIDILKLSLKRSKDIESHEEPCWVLRHGIDLAYYSLKPARTATKTARHN